jgi:hypothetical protein
MREFQLSANELLCRHDPQDCAAPIESEMTRINALGETFQVAGRRMAWSLLSPKVKIAANERSASGGLPTKQQNPSSARENRAEWWECAALEQAYDQRKEY